MAFPIEIIKVKRKDCPKEAACDMIHSNGRLKLLGTGGYANVWGSKRSNIVYKVGKWEHYDGYMAYIKMLHKHCVENPYLPKIYGMRVYSNSKESYYVIAMEKLKKLPYSMRHIVDAFEEVWETWTYNERVHEGRKMLGIKMAVVYPKGMKEALDVVRDAKKSSRLIGYDVHDGNFMLRGKQVVITDPLC